jgi:hypothetical protein
MVKFLATRLLEKKINMVKFIVKKTIMKNSLNPHYQTLRLFKIHLKINCFYSRKEL